MLQLWSPSKMLSETGLALLLDHEASPRAGVLTPATALGPALRRRLTKAEKGRFMQTPGVGLTRLKKMRAPYLDTRLTEYVPGRIWLKKYPVHYAGADFFARARSFG